jgi:anthranilate phosphoribosyltransferase
VDDIKKFLLKINNYPYLLYLNAAAMVYKKYSITINAPENVMDVCGTGGDGLKTLNVSTAVAFVVAACGIPVAKHGNRAVSSASGSADIFKQLGIDIEISKEKAEECLEKNNLVFLFAPNYHPAFKHVLQARKELGVKTIFNYLGPLLNPAKLKYQLIGCSNLGVAKYLQASASFSPSLFSSKNILVVHGNDGMDELSISDDSVVFGIRDSINFNPEDFGFKKVPITQIQGADVVYNTEKLMELLQGKAKNSAYYNIVVLNAALALYVTKEDLKFNNFSQLFGASLKDAREAIDRGIDGDGALEVLRKLQNFNKK